MTKKILLTSLALLACEDPVERATPEIILTLPHDTAAYTQGLVFHNRLLWESTGGWGRSTIRQVDPRTGTVLRSRALPDSLFGEGLALVDSTLVQGRYDEARAVEGTFARIAEQVRTVPGVRSGAAGTRVPIWGRSIDMGITVDGRARDPDRVQIGHVRLVTDGYEPP